MTDRKIELTRRKVLAGLGTVGVASAGAALGTSAYFSDGETFEGNTLTAGELDLRIDWQQLYYGPEANADHFQPYGEAGYPFVNAHPDHNTDGMQSLDLGAFEEGEFAEEDGTVSYMDGVEDPDDGRNIQEYLTCETLANYEVPDDFDNGVREQNSLIELEDIKPGDCGEITFSLHLCDNPGYVWMMGQTGPEFDEDLARAIQVEAWYDIECTNTLVEDDGDIVLIETTDLQTFLDERLEPDGRFLTPSIYGDVGVRPGDEDEFEAPCLDLDPITLETDGASVENGELLEVRDETDAGVDEVELLLRLETDDGDVWFDVLLSDLQIPSPDGLELQTATNVADDDLTEITRFDWEIVDSSDDLGFCEVVINENSDNLVTFDGCTTSQTNVNIPESADEEEIDVIEFRYCPDVGIIPPCFPPDQTFCVAVKWCLPTRTPSHLDDINELQGQSVSFDLGFYTEQCRHNELPSGPSGFS